MQRLNLAQEPDKRHGLLCHVTGKNFQASEGKEPKMNMTKRTLLTMILLTMVLQIALSGCAGSGGRGKSLYEHGLDVVALMDEIDRKSVV